MIYTPAQIEDIKQRNRVDEAAGRLVDLRNARPTRDFPHGRQIGPCPFCSRDARSKTDSRFEADGERWVCAACADGGDIIAFVAKERGLDPRHDFLQILGELGGAAEPEVTPAVARRQGNRDHRAGVGRDAVPSAFAGPPALAAAWREGWDAARAADAENARYRERERRRLYDNYWRKALPWPGTPVEDYFRRRRLLVPPNACIGYLADCPMHADGGERALLAHSGPAMLCPIFRPDDAHPRGYRFAGLHFTWLDLARSKGKAVVLHPETGELLPAKKSRGSKQGGYIDLGGSDPAQAEALVTAEGVENTCVGYTILVRAGRDLSRTAFRCGIDLGNLAGKALDRLPHPTLRTDSGRVRKVPGIVPNMDSPVMPVPPQIGRLLYMCDSDSDPFITRCAMQRAEARHARAGLKQILMWPGNRRDWNDRLT